MKKVPESVGGIQRSWIEGRQPSYLLTRSVSPSIMFCVMTVRSAICRSVEQYLGDLINDYSTDCWTSGSPDFPSKTTVSATSRKNCMKQQAGSS